MLKSFLKMEDSKMLDTDEGAIKFHSPFPVSRNRAKFYQVTGECYEMT